MKKLVHLVICTFLFLCFTGATQATSITIENPSFEIPDIGTTVDGSNVNGRWILSVDDWDLTGTNDAGTYEPNVTNAFNYIPDGDQVAFTWGPTITQTLTTDLAANTLYSLSAYVGWRKNQNSAPNFSIELLGGEAALASINTAPLTKGNWTEVTLTYLSPDSVSDDLSLGIRLSGSNGTPVDFDMISLSAVPEPTTILLFGFGLLGIAKVSRRKNNAG